MTTTPTYIVPSNKTYLEAWNEMMRVIVQGLGIPSHLLGRPVELTHPKMQLALPWPNSNLLALPWCVEEEEEEECEGDEDEEEECEEEESGEDDEDEERDKVEEEEWEFKPEEGTFRCFSENGTKFFVWDTPAVMMRQSKPECYVGREFRSTGEPYAGRNQPTLEAFLNDTKLVWQHGIDKVEECLAELRHIEIPGLRDHKRRIRFREDVGDDLDYDRFRGGQVDYWRNSEREDCQGPNEVTIFVDLTTPYHYLPDEVLWRGAASIALAEILEEKGLRVEMWITHGFSQRYGYESGDDSRYLYACCLKRTGDPLDRSTLINCVSAWFYRNGMFSVEVSLKHRPIDKSNWCNAPTQEDLDQISRDQQRIYCSGVFSKQAAIRLIEAEVEKIATHNI